MTVTPAKVRTLALRGVAALAFAVVAGQAQAQTADTAPSPPAAFGNVAPVTAAPPPPASSARPKPKPVAVAPALPPQAPAPKQEAAQPAPKQQAAKKEERKKPEKRAEKKAEKKPVMSAREEISLLQRPCARELTRFCSRVRAGAARWTNCLKPHERQLSRTCRTALVKTSAKE